MRQIKIITTFSKNGYDVYGKTWIDTFSKYVEDKNVSVDLYIDFPLIVNDNRISIIDYNTVIPNHLNWLKSFDERYDGGAAYNKKMAMRFSYKAFVMQHAIENNNDILIWLDGDCVFRLGQDFKSFPEDVLNGNFIAVQREANGGNDHCESGFVAFDLKHVDKEKFLNQFKEAYQLENVIHMNQPYDGFLIYKSLSGITYTDLNEGYTKGGIQSDPGETFLNPALKSRFLHNIGLTGKQQYSNFSEISKYDQYFKLIQNRNNLTPEEVQQKRMDLISLRNKNK